MNRSTNQHLERLMPVSCDGATIKKPNSRSADSNVIGPSGDSSVLIGQQQVKKPQLPQLPPPGGAPLQSHDSNKSSPNSSTGSSENKRGLIKRILNRPKGVNNTSPVVFLNDSSNTSKGKGMGNVQQGRHVSLSNNSFTGSIGSNSSRKAAGGGGDKKSNEDATTGQQQSSSRHLMKRFNPSNNKSNHHHQINDNSNNSARIHTCGDASTKPSPPTVIVNDGDASFSSTLTRSQLLQQVNQQKQVIDQLRQQLISSQRRTQELERDLDKVRSVLDQQLADKWVNTSQPQSPTSNHDPQGETVTTNGLLPSPPPPQTTTTDGNSEGGDLETAAPAKNASTSSATGNPTATAPSSSSSSSTRHSINNIDSLDTGGGVFLGSPESPKPPPAAFLLQKRLGVSGESIKEPAKQLDYHDKDAKARQQIREALRGNELLMNLDAVQLQEMVSCMHSESVPANSYIIRENDDGQYLYVSSDGNFEVSKSGKRLCLLPAGKCFGELALLYNCKRTASVKALTAGRVWVLTRHCFQTIMMRTGMERIEERKAFLRSVPLLQNLSNDRILRIADALEAQYHSPNDCIIRQNELADSFFIIQSGEVSVKISSEHLAADTANSTSTTDTDVVKTVRRMTRGQWFGEKALLGEGRRTASVYAEGPDGVEVLCLYRKDFLELIGDIQELKNTDYADQGRSIDRSDGSNKHQLATPLHHPTANHTASIKSATAGKGSEFKPCKLPPCNFSFSDLEHVSVLGVGGFGRVDLVTIRHDQSRAFAMKRMQKQHIVQTHQQEHVLLEKIILASVSSPFICRLYATYRDSKYVYMLLEACLGGELWTLLRDAHRLDDKTTKFCLASSIEALDYLHSHGIIYRDLKPENLLVTANGYIKLCDFGFAKYIGIGNKTWTFCGTPEYVAPEVILNQGHDFAADYWSLGILTYELLNGTPPFQAAEPIKIYMRTLKGIDALGLAHNKHISLKALHFIRRLCRFNPSERMGLGKHGIQEIRSHKYFQGFDWDSVAKLSMPSPFQVTLSGPLDCSNFDRFTMDEQEAPDESSGWDANF